jgi:hypothetical protein
MYGHHLYNVQLVDESEGCQEALLVCFLPAAVLLRGMLLLGNVCLAILRKHSQDSQFVLVLTAVLPRTSSYLMCALRSCGAGHELKSCAGDRLKS